MKTLSVLLAFILVALGFESRAAAPTPTNTLITTNIPITTNVANGYFLVHVPVSGSSLGLRQASLAVVSAAVGGSGVSLSTVTNIVVGITTPQSNSLRTLTLQVGLANTNYTTAVSNSLYSLAYALAASGTNNVTSLSNAIIAYVSANSSITNAVGGAGQYQLLLGNKLRRLEFTGDATVTTNGDLISVDVTAGTGASNSVNGSQVTNIVSQLLILSNYTQIVLATNSYLATNNLQILNSTNMQVAFNKIDAALIDSASTGIRHGGAVTDSGGAEIDVASGAGVILDNSTPSAPIYRSVTWGASNNISLPNGLSYVYVASDGLVRSRTTAPDHTDYRTNIWLARVSVTLGDVTAVSPIPMPAQQYGPQIWDLFKALGPTKNGLEISANATDLTIEVAQGEIYSPGVNFFNDPLNPHESQFSVASPATFRMATQTGPVGSDITSLMVTNYDVGGTVTAIPGASTRATIFTVYRFASGNIRILYGQELYTSLADAVADIGSYSPVVPTGFNEAIILGWIAATKGCTNLADTANAQFVIANRFGGVGSSSAANLSSYTTFSDVTNVFNGFAPVLTNANTIQQRLVTNQNVKTISAGSNFTITDQGTNLVLAASLSGGSASLQDVTNTVNALAILNSSGNGTNTTLVNPTIIGGPLTNSLRSLRQYRMIVDGDSQTDDAGLPGFANWVQQLVWTNSSTNIFAPFNAAKSGSTVASLLSEDRAGRLRRLATNEAGIYLQAIGINSLLADLDAVTIAGQLTNSWRRYRTNGWKVVAFTPFGTNTLTASQHTNLINLCTIIRNSSAEYDYLVDAVTNTAITLSDNLHPTVAGSTALMQQVKQTIEPEYLIGLPQQAGAAVGKQIFSAKQANDFGAEFTEGSSLRFKVPGSNPFQGVYWAGPYGDSLRITAEGTNGMDSILFWAYARKVMRILGDPSGVLGDRVAIGVNAVTNQNFLTNGYRLYVSGHGYFEDITAGSGITGILRGGSGSFLTNATSFNNFKIANSGFLLFGYGSSNHVATGVSSNNNYGISVPDNSYVLKTAPGVNYYVGIGSSVWGFLTNGTLVWPDGTISSNSMPTNVTSNVKYIGTTQLRGGLDASSNHWAMGISSNNNFGLDLTNNTAVVLDTAPLVDVLVSSDTNRWKFLSTRGTDAARIEWPNGVLESAQIHAAFSAGHIPTNYTPGNGVGGGISGGVLTTYTTNITHVLATNLTTVALHGNTVTNEYFLSEAHAAIAVNPTNFTGFTNREIVLMIENSSGATRTITINTNGWGGAIRWHRFPANSGNTVNLTNNSTLELNFKLTPSGRMVVAGSLAQ